MSADSPPAGERQSRDRIRFAAIASAIFFAAHVPYLASTLEDLDSINFALGIHEFDPAKHQPHPPGYPIFMAMARLSSLVLRDPAALAVWGAIFGALAAFPLVWMYWKLEALDRAADDDRRLTRSISAAIVAMTSPLFWFTASRPMSDTVGLAVALAAQTVLVAAFVAQQPGDGGHRAGAIPASGRLIVIGALVCGIALGLRAQAGWLTLPLLAVVVLDRTGRGAAGALIGAAMTFAIGVLVWAPALVVASGGWSRYTQALASQAGEDVGGDALFVSAPSARRLAFELEHVFLRPWAVRPLAIAVLLLAAIGAAALLRRNRRALVLLGAMAVPYLVFHLLFQETITVRYALPLVPAVAYLAIRGLDAVSGRFTRVGAFALAAVSLVITVPALRTYAREGSPIFRAIADMTSRAATRRPGALAMHFPFVRSLKVQPVPGVPQLQAPPHREWLSLVQYWKEGRREPVWFLADPRRTDLALVDPGSRRQLQRYGWTIPTEQFLSGIRPDQAQWFTMDPPGWFLEEGWSLTPETAGDAATSGKGPAVAPIAGYVRRRAASTTLMYGGRHLGAAGDPDVRFAVTIDGQRVDDAVARADTRFFVRMLPLPAGTLAGSGEYATLAIVARAADGSSRPVKAAVEQFDIQPEGAVVFGFDRGWHELEYSGTLRRLFRWSSGSATLLVHHAGRDVTLKLTGESPRRYFDAMPTVTIRVGDRVLATFTPDASPDEFVQTIRVPADALDASRGRLTIDTDRTFVPAERSGSPDKRQLGLRIFSLTVD